MRSNHSERSAVSPKAAQTQRVQYKPRPLSLAAKDSALSRRHQGFEFPRGHHLSLSPPFYAVVAIVIVASVVREHR